MAVRKLLTSNSHVEFPHHTLHCLVYPCVTRNRARVYICASLYFQNTWHIMGRSLLLFLVLFFYHSLFAWAKWILHSNSHIPTTLRFEEKCILFFNESLLVFHSLSPSVARLPFFLILHEICDAFDADFLFFRMCSEMSQKKIFIFLLFLSNFLRRFFFALHLFFFSVILGNMCAYH